MESLRFSWTLLEKQLQFFLLCFFFFLQIYLIPAGYGFQVCTQDSIILLVYSDYI